MDILKTIPEQVIPSAQVGFTVMSINIDVPNKIGKVEVLRGERTETYTADLSSEWAGVSAPNKTVILAFLKSIVKICMSVGDSDITGDAL